RRIAAAAPHDLRAAARAQARALVEVHARPPLLFFSGVAAATLLLMVLASGFVQSEAGAADAEILVVHRACPFDEDPPRCGTGPANRAWFQAQCLAGWATVALLR